MKIDMYSAIPRIPSFIHMSSHPHSNANVDTMFVLLVSIHLGSLVV